MKLHYQAHLHNRAQTLKAETLSFCPQHILIYNTFVDVNENSLEHGNSETNFSCRKENELTANRVSNVLNY